MTFAIRTDELTKRYRLGQLSSFRVAELFRHRAQPEVVEALRDVSFEVPTGQVVGLVGANGSGKSTLLKILSRVTPPDAGTATLRGRIGSLLEVGTGFHPELTGRDNIYLNGSILGMRRREIAAQFDEIVEFSELSRFLDTPVKRYSSGMFVRLAFSVAAHLRTDILLVDEVLAVGDASFQRKCLGKMDEVTSEGRTIVFVSHDLGAVQALCSRGLLLQQGRLIADGTVESVVATYLASTLSTAGTSVDYPDDTDKVVQIRHADVRCSARTEGWDFNEQIDVHLTVVTRRDIVGTNLGITVKREGVPVFISFDIDVNPGANERRSAGTTCYRVRIPKGLLKAGRYTIDLRTEKTSLEYIDRRQDALAFELHELSEHVHHQSYARWRPGAVVTRIPWTIEPDKESP